MGGNRAIALVVIVAAIVAAGCGTRHGAPTAAHAGTLLRQHITSLMTKISATNIRVTAAGEISCGKGRAERAYAVSASVAQGDTRPENLVDMMLGSVNADAAYAIVDPMVAGHYAVTMRDVQSRTNLTLASPGEGLVTAAGRTDCLKTS